MIAARSCCPSSCASSSGRSWAGPTGTRSTLSLAGVVAFAGLYISNDAGVTVDGASGRVWLFIWWISRAAMTYGKWMPGRSRWRGRTRLLHERVRDSPAVLLFFATGENASLNETYVGDNAALWLVRAAP